MSEQQIELDRVQKALAKNTSKLNTAKQNAVISEVHIKTYESQIEHQTKLYNDIVNKFRMQIDKTVDNAKLLHKRLEDLLKEKEALHLELRAASNFGKVQCEWCKRYYTDQGLKRHQATCIAKPEVKIEKKHKEEVKEIKEDLAARKASLEKELADLKKVAKE